MNEGARTALIAGATGLVGRELASQLSGRAHWFRVVAAVRGAPDPPLSSGVTPAVVDFEHLDRAGDTLAAHDVFCALGTTIRQARTREAFRRVDFDYVVTLARLARERGAGHFLLVSSHGADARSRIFYSRVKGEVEEAIRAIGYPSVTIARPSLLLGHRREFRLGEELAKPVGWLFPRSIRPIQARHVAAALIHAAEHAESGVRILTSAAMQP
jgi:uncharacterized protein YbjT (DUF2867 family)